jgi:hypothetical protein
MEDSILNIEEEAADIDDYAFTIEKVERFARIYLPSIKDWAHNIDECVHNLSLLRFKLTMFYRTSSHPITKLDASVPKTSTPSPSKQSDVALLFPPGGAKHQCCRIVVRATHHVAPSSECYL